MKSVTFQGNTLIPTNVASRRGTKRRVGQPRVKWVETGLDALWEIIGKTTRPDFKYALLDLSYRSHERAIKEASELITQQQVTELSG